MRGLPQRVLTVTPTMLDANLNQKKHCVAAAGAPVPEADLDDRVAEANAALAAAGDADDK